MLEAQPDYNWEDRAVRPRLGLVCITASNAVRFRTLTRTRFLSLDAAKRRSTLEELYRDNLKRLNEAITFCATNFIQLYRFSSDLFPMSDLPEDPTGGELLQELSSELAKIGERANRFGIRLVLHPDQFVVLNSESAQTVQNSIRLLDQHALVMDMLQQPRSAWASINIHGGKGGRSQQLIEIIPQLSEGVRSRLTLENDEYIYSASEILNICRQAKVAMVFDVHHHVCYEKLESLEDPSIAQMVAAARETWPQPDWQMVHLSNGKTRMLDRAHHDFITQVPSAYASVPWIEVEAKAKEEAIQKLREIWPIAR